MNTYLLLYLLGAICSFALCKILRYYATAHESSDKAYTVLFTLLSFIGIVIIGILRIGFYISDVYGKRNS